MNEEVTEEITTVSNPQQVVKTTRVEPQAGNTEPPQKALAKKKVIFRAYQIIWYVLAIIEVLLGFRMALKALGANQLSGFVNLVYSLSDPLALPFRGILGTTVSGAMVFEWSTLIAALVYAVIAYGAVYLMQIIKPVSPHEVEQKVDNP